MFRASINGCGGPLSYSAANHRWSRYCAAAGVDIDINQLRHSYADGAR
ncbi:site-specific integrase [Nocardia shimofusensis]|nr:site-specific integrase [Nocardia shimofusensis]